MVVTTMASLLILLKTYAKNSNYILMVTDVLLFLLAVAVIILAVRTFWKPVEVSEQAKEVGVT